MPSSSTVPCVGLSSRASARSRVDLPQALGPTITVTLPGGMDTERSATTTACRRRSEASRSSPRRRRLVSRRALAHSLILHGRHPVRTGQQPQQVRRPDDAGDDADGQLRRREQATGDEVGEHHDSAPTSADVHDGERIVASGGGRSGAATKATKMIGPAAAVASAASATATKHEQRAGRARPRTPRPLRRVVAELHRAQRSDEQERRDRDEHDNGDEPRCARRPSPGR